VVTMKNVVFWDVTPCGSCKNRRLAGTYCLHLQGEKNRRSRSNDISNQQKKPVVFLRSVRSLLIAPNVVPTSPILVRMNMESMGSSETWVLTRATRRNTQEDGILGIKFGNCLDIFFQTIILVLWRVIFHVLWEILCSHGRLRIASPEYFFLI
jgi:hypothetical protein